MSLSKQRGNAEGGMVDPILVYVPFTEDLAAMAAAANMGESRIPKTG